MGVYRKTVWSPKLQQLKDRLMEEAFYYPHLFLISVGLGLILTGVSQLLLDPRLGQSIVPVAFESKESTFPKIWLGVGLIDEKLTVTTQDRKVFSLPLDAQKGEEVDLLEKEIAGTAERALMETVLIGIPSQARFKVVLSLDQKLTYEHVKPLLLLLAKANLTNIAFETRLIATEVSSEKKVAL